MKRNHLLLYTLLVMILYTAASCKKAITDPAQTDTTTTPGTGTGGVVTPVDPPVANTIGFFLNEWQPKSFLIPGYTDASIPATGANIVTVNPSSIITKVAPTLFGNNTNTWMTQMVNEPVLLNHIANLQTKMLRAPGGSISDVYFWNAPNNTPPADAPTQFVNANGTTAPANFWYGKNGDSWTMSLDNYYNVLLQTHNQGIITVNYGYARYSTANNPVAAAAHLAADWVRYDNGRTKYWEIGNESYGDWEAGYRINTATNKDGQPEIITGELYGQHVKVFLDSMRKAAQEIGKQIYIGATLVEAEPQGWNTNTVKTWNNGVLGQLGNAADFYIVHSYYTPFNTNSTAIDILNTATTTTKSIATYVTQQVQSKGLQQKPIALTEWNIFATGSKQQVSHIAGMHATMVLGELLKNKFGQASRWDLANGWSNGDDHGLFNIGDEPDGVAKWNPRPAFYHMYFFQKMLGDRAISSISTNSANIESYASSFKSGHVGVTLVNKSNQAQTVEVKLQNFTAGNRFYWYTLMGGNDNGEFSRKVFVNGKGPSGAAGGPTDYATLKANSSTTQNGIKVSIPARSVVNMVIDKK